MKQAGKCEIVSLGLLMAGLLVQINAGAADDLVPLRLKTVINVPMIAAPTLDGTIGPEEYARAQPLTHWGANSKAAMTQTAALVGRDDQHLYIAARCFDTQMDELVSESSALWQNDCIEVFVDVEKKTLFFSHVIGDCAAAFSGDMWIPDEWGEPTRGPKVEALIKSGREKDAWTLEMAIPLKAFGVPIRADSVWSLGLCREKKTEPGENSSFLGWFNRPATWPDMTFDKRRLVVEGTGLKNISDRKVKADVTFKAAASANEGEPIWKETKVALSIDPGETAAVDWSALMTKLGVNIAEESLFAYDLKDGEYTVSEAYRLVQRKEAPKPVDPNVVPQAHFVKSVLDDPDFWPVAVWGQPAGPAAKYKEAGVNIFVGGAASYPVPRDMDYMNAIWQHGMHAILPATAYNRWGYYFAPGSPKVTEGQIADTAGLVKRLSAPDEDAAAAALLALIEEKAFIKDAMDYMAKRQGQTSTTHTRALADQLATVVEWKNLANIPAFAGAAAKARSKWPDLDKLPKEWRNRRILETELGGALVEIPMMITEHPAFLGWLFGDEPDNAGPGGGPKHTPEDIFSQFVKLRTFDNRHPIFLNLGCGVAHERFVGRGATDEMYPRYAQACDILCYDVYPCNSISPNGPDRLHLQGKGVKRLRQWAGPDRGVWTWIEVNHFSTDGSGREPTHDEIKTQHWMAIVHGASGHGYFCHSWSKKFHKERLGSNKSFSVSAIAPDTLEAIGRINAEIRPLASVLNSPTVDYGTAMMKKGRRVDYRVKEKHGVVYLFAVNMYREPATAEFKIAGIGDATADVLHEERSVTVKSGVFTEDFAPYAVHRYRIVK